MLLEHEVLGPILFARLQPGSTKFIHGLLLTGAGIFLRVCHFVLRKMPFTGRGTSHRTFAQKTMRLFTGEDTHPESYATLSSRNCHSWHQVELGSTFWAVCFPVLERKLNVSTTFQKRVLGRRSVCGLRACSHFIDKLFPGKRCINSRRSR